MVSIRINPTGKNIHLCLAAIPKLEVDCDNKNERLKENAAQKIGN